MRLLIIAFIGGTVSLVDSSVFGSVVQSAQMTGLTDGTTPVLVRSNVEAL